MADIFCETEIPDYQQQECGVENGGVIALGLIDPDVWVGENDTERLSKLELESWWTTGETASPQTHWVVLNTRGSKAAGTPVEEDGFGLNSTERTGDDQELVFEALGVLANRDFWAGVNKRTNWGLVYINKGSGGNLIGHYASDVSIYADTVIDQSIKSRIRISGSAKWSTAMTPSLPFTAPTSVFTP